MSLSDVPLITCVQDTRDNQAVDKNIAENVCTDEKSYGDEEHSDIVRCFVCDVAVQGRRYALASCKTQNSRSRVIEKLGELVGERYVVVISEDDVICRSCANLINTLDRLESEMKQVKSSVLRFLEEKYSLEEGELLRCSDVPRLCQPPQITRNDSRKLDYHSRKRGPISLDDANRPPEKRNKSNTWMRCDKCHYTTLNDAFMAHHARTRVKRNIDCGGCGVKFSANQAANHRCKNHTIDNNSMAAENPLEGIENARAIQTAPLETIDLAGTAEDMEEDLSLIPTISIPSTVETDLPPKEEHIQLIDLTNPNALQFQNFLANDGTLRDGQPLFMRVLQQLGVGDDLEQSSMIPVIDNEAMIRTKDNTAKQMLTLAEDGSLEMVAVDCWNDEDQTNGDSQTIL